MPSSARPDPRLGAPPLLTANVLSSKGDDMAGRPIKMARLVTELADTGEDLAFAVLETCPDQYSAGSDERVRTDLIDAAWYAACAKAVDAAEALLHLAKLLRLKAGLPDPWAAPVEATNPAPAAPMGPTETSGGGCP